MTLILLMCPTLTHTDHTPCNIGIAVGCVYTVCAGDILLRPHISENVHLVARLCLLTYK